MNHLKEEKKMKISEKNVLPISRGRGFLIILCLFILLTGCGTKGDEVTKDEFDETGSTQTQTQEPLPEQISESEDMTGTISEDGEAGSSETPSSETKDTEADSSESPSNEAEDMSNEMIDGDALIASAVVQGSMVERSNNSFTIVIPEVKELEDGGQVESMPAAGYEKEEELVTVIMEEECEIQVATMDVAKGTTILGKGTKEDVEQQSSVLLYGAYNENNEFSASKVIVLKIING